MILDPLIRVAPGVFIRRRFLPAYREAERQAAAWWRAKAAAIRRSALD